MMQPEPQPLMLEDIVTALLDPRAPATDLVTKTIQVAMSGFGYNFYDARNVARSNDALVRERAAGLLGEATAALTGFERAYRERILPAATRESPFPSEDVMRRLRALDALRKRFEAAISALASAETPGNDAIWRRFRDERALLVRLVAADVELATGAERLRDAVNALDPNQDDLAALEPVKGQLATLEHALTGRRALLRAA
jgi:hypothetical protein